MCNGIAQILEKFVSVMAIYDRSLLDKDPSLHLGLTDDLRIAYTNDAWETFARQNGGESILRNWRVGSAWTACLPDVVHSFYLLGFANARSTGVAFEYGYECSSPTTKRIFQMRTHPLRRGFMTVHSLRSEKPVIADPTVHSEYRTAHGFVVQCAECRRVRRADGSQAWDWVRRFVEHRESNISHGLCATCAEIYHPDPALAIV